MTSLEDFKRNQITGVTERTSEEKVKFVESELDGVMNGGRQIMMCPFCHALNTPPGEGDKDSFCCTLFGVTVTAAFQKVINQDLKDIADRIADKIHG